MQPTMNRIPSSMPRRRTLLWVTFIVALTLTLLLTLKAAVDFSHTGPQIRSEVLAHYTGYLIYAMARLAAWVFLILLLLAGWSTLWYVCVIGLLRRSYHLAWHVFTLCCGVGLIFCLQFSAHLLYIPASINASFNYEIKRLYPLWELLTPERIYFLYSAVLALALLPVIAYIARLIRQRASRTALLYTSMMIFYGALLAAMIYDPEPAPLITATAPPRPNILMIGSDTLRSDRLGSNGYARPLTPRMDALAHRGVSFTQCIVPIARTAPSLASLFTSSWPHTHGIRDNYIADAQSQLPVSDLARHLKQHGYRTATVGDWASSDLGKFNFGFDTVDVPPDQWNLKFLLRQGPQDLRLFLSLFTHNRLGKMLLPEIYYTAGTPLTARVGRDARRLIAQLGQTAQPFFLNVFIASTHAPFGSAYPYYRAYSDPNYRGRSLFSMADVARIEDIVSAQEKDARTFDIAQINALYDGAVRSFDDEVGRFLDYLTASGLAANTLVIIYSDHGADLFENESWGQGNVLSDASYRVPLIIHDPRHTGTAIAPRSVPYTVRSLDIAPTILDLAGLPPLPHAAGLSLRPYMNGTETTDRPAFGETGVWIAAVKGLPKTRLRYPTILDLLEIRDKATGTLAFKAQYETLINTAKARMIRQGPWQLVYFPLQQGASYQLYNIVRDPALQVDVAAQYPHIVQHLLPQLTAWIQSDPTLPR